MTKQQRYLINQLEMEHIRMSGCIDALLIIDDNTAPNLQRYREAVTTLHHIMSNTMTDTAKIMEEIYKTTRRIAA